MDNSGIASGFFVQESFHIIFKKNNLEISIDIPAVFGEIPPNNPQELPIEIPARIPTVIFCVVSARTSGKIPIKIS